jgi:hypothetical protein
MLIALDDTLLHQTPESMAHAGVSDHRFFDRTAFGMQSPTGDLALISSFGVYKNMNVMDGFAMIQKRARRQYNHRYSRRLSSDPMTLRLGPLSIQHLEPLKGRAAGSKSKANARNSTTGSPGAIIPGVCGRASAASSHSRDVKRRPKDSWASIAGG